LQARREADRAMAALMAEEEREQQVREKGCLRLREAEDTALVARGEV
jgi:hypothetical protein